jgi:hypothetical protein
VITLLTRLCCSGRVRLNWRWQAIRCPRFWGYAFMVDTIGQFLDHFSNFSESCPCHRHVGGLVGASRHQRRAHLWAEAQLRQCPMSTRMAPEFANGEHMLILRQLSSVAHQNLLLDASVAPLAELDKRIILEDFARARRHILFTIQLKMGFWRSLPWVLFGLGHTNEGIARTCGQRALQLFAQAGDNSDHHFLSMFMCSPGGRGHAEMLQFCGGNMPREQFPVLMRMAARFRFAMVTERWIEGRHAQIKSHLRAARHTSVVHTAFHGALIKM